MYSSQYILLFDNFSLVQDLIIFAPCSHSFIQPVFPCSANGNIMQDSRKLAEFHMCNFCSFSLTREESYHQKSCGLIWQLDPLEKCILSVTHFHAYKLFICSDFFPPEIEWFCFPNLDGYSVFYNFQWFGKNSSNFITRNVRPLGEIIHFLWWLLHMLAQWVLSARMTSVWLSSWCGAKPCSSSRGFPILCLNRAALQASLTAYINT